MDTRESFANWISQHQVIQESGAYIKRSQFFNIQERAFVFNTIETLLYEQTIDQEALQDYKQLEEKRYTIFDNYSDPNATAITEIEKAIRFCALDTKTKRKSNFKVAPNLSEYLVQSIYPWNGTKVQKSEDVMHNYLFMPSFLPMLPKEISLVDFNAVLLDIIHYDEAFSFTEFFELIAEAMDIKEDELDTMLLDFLSHQVLYYRTILYLP